MIHRLPESRSTIQVNDKIVFVDLIIDLIVYLIVYLDRLPQVSGQRSGQRRGQRNDSIFGFCRGQRSYLGIVDLNFS